MAVAVFPGSFDPLTLGHTDIIDRALPLLDGLHIAIGINTAKKYLFDLDKRVAMLKAVYGKENKITIRTYEGLTVDYCQSVDAQWIIRGLRNSIDFEYERAISGLNQSLGSGIETIFLAASPQYSHISSTIVREILIHKGDASPFLPPGVADLV